MCRPRGPDPESAAAPHPVLLDTVDNYTEADEMVTFKVNPDGSITLNLDRTAATDLHEMLEMLDLDGFSLEEGDRLEKIETKFAVQAATAPGAFQVR